MASKCETNIGKVTVAAIVAAVIYLTLDLDWRENIGLTT